MIDSNIYKPFDAIKAPLEGSNLIEASAGTGKTYSIAILVLRLILEQKLSIKEILMVTFTRAAVAELEERIRLFIRQAYKASLGKDIPDETIFNLVLDVIDPEDPIPTQQLLRDAILLLDETAVLTIHGFCQQTLNEYAFETNQLFGAQMVPDLTPIVENELNKFWRKHITTLKTELLENIWDEKMKPDMQQVIQEHLSGKKYIGYTEDIPDTISEAQQDSWLQEIAQQTAKIQAAIEALYDWISAHSPQLETACLANRYTKKDWPELVTQPELLVKKILEKKDAKYIAAVFPDILEELDKIEEMRHQLTLQQQAIRRQVFYTAIKEVGEEVRLFKERSNMMGYDDLINNLHTALVKNENPELTASLRNKYKAVFVDEFQDTDREQFEIFNQAFGQNTILFYIGDPKQSIYAWRKADIFTYFKARNGVQQIYDMDQNFRSSENLIRAMNLFFKPTPDFDTFNFGQETNSIDYIQVNSPAGNNKGYLFKGRDKEVPIAVITCEKKESVCTAVAAQVAQLLLNKDYHITNDRGTRTITPSDIGVLVRTGQEGKDIKHALAKLGIPAVTIDEARVLRTGEAQQLLHLLEAMETPDRSSINRALLGSFTGYNAHTILKLDDEIMLDLFAKYRTLWQRDGAYTALMEFISDFSVRHVLLDGTVENGERIITNLYQLSELVHQVQSRKNLSMRDLISWLKRGIDGMTTDGDEYAQRVESDEEAVNIVTIHKSKGLEYKIVMAPFLDFVEQQNIELVSFRDPVTGDYLSTQRSRLSEDQLAAYQQQQEQENRRLIYVAITRAVYKCYLFKNSYARFNDSSLAIFLKELKKISPEQAVIPGITTVLDTSLIDLNTPVPAAPEENYRQQITKGQLAVNRTSVNFRLLEQNWRKMSYTMLAAKAEHRPRIRSIQQTDPYDNFIFTTLRRGAKTGNLLHFIFESINFADSSKWEYWLEEAIRRFVPGHRELYLERLNEMLQHVMYSTIQVGGTSFQLASVGRHQRLAEFEFDFPVPVFQSNLLNQLSDDEVSVSIRRFSEYSSQELEGIMNGKIDLFFEHGGKYYILDWKSNYLGNSITDYDATGLAAAMNENNYHLQYFIYTVAVKKYLESRLPYFDYHSQFGGIIYCFVRGVRNNAGYGFYTTKPALDKIQRLERLLTK
ncbi:DNA helicase/exodeoxyribonuclease V beta subunit [Chitinophaga polysaccharea]|uniref:RecBCD enzyme subunit RecB n=1 Tax=Chitinophaga polysaccharea TaxID=1293035 RepID=A0A561Q3C4_9BACT|nr:exodeoxyribonuclease V subunit beta [Chitinophaga polysaccharea]TWF44871.1 DNA helicase/exodeoxyribonuclease V beta subunit [Chitinophaga polysaccharea]